jgi:hypothetical protein
MEIVDIENSSNEESTHLQANSELSINKQTPKPQQNGKEPNSIVRMSLLSLIGSIHSLIVRYFFFASE